MLTETYSFYIWAWTSPPQLGVVLVVLVSLKFKLFDFFGGIIGMFEKTKLDRRNTL